ncbi:hypothetical protein [Stappia sp.]|uniref:hypothetical protein n=1 Tax=Stappia sp. TaxID=1870903 RepID=UPI0032D8E2F3
MKNILHLLAATGLAVVAGSLGVRAESVPPRPETSTSTPSIEEINARSAGADLDRLREDVLALADLAEAHIKHAGLVPALDAFEAAPWKRKANGLHIWGVTTGGISWYDVGHPDLVGIDVSNITDIEGRHWARLARASADGTGEEVFGLVFPHPETNRSAQGLHTCFLLPDGERILCAGGFVDEER